MFNKVLQLYPAYGRRYTTIKDFKKDYNEGKDFNSDRSYTSVRDIYQLLEDDFKTVYFKVTTKNGNTFIVYIIRFGEVQRWVNKNG